MSDLVRRIDHSAEPDRDLLRQVYSWAEQNPALYLDGSGYRDAEGFLDPPARSLEYVVVAGGKPAALLTFIPLATMRNVYQVGLIANPEANLRKICKLLIGFMGAFLDGVAQALFVELPDSSVFAPTRKLTLFLGFDQISPTTFLITRYGHAQKTRDKNNNAIAADRDDRLHRRIQVLRHDARGARALGMDAQPDAV